jgi:hypothetical protein
MTSLQPQTRPIKIESLPVFGGVQKSPKGSAGSAPSHGLSADAQKNFFSPEARTFSVDSLPAAGRPERVGPVNSAVDPAHLPRGTVSQVKTADDQLVEQARKLVSQTFYGTLLKQMHNSPFKSEMFTGGRGEEAFRPMYDALLADRMARSSADKLVRPIVNGLKKQAAKAYDKQQQKGAADVGSDR